MTGAIKAERPAARDALKLALFAGEIMMTNGAETQRVEDTMKRLLVNCGYARAESFVTTTGLFVSVEDDEFGPVTMIRRVRVKDYNFDRVARVNDVSRAFAEGKLTVAEAISALDAASVTIVASPFAGVAASGAACFAFCYIFGGAFLSDCVNAFFTGIIMYFFVTPMRARNVNYVLINALGGAVISLSSLAMINLGLGENIDKIIIGSLMPLLPGITMTNAIRDILGGDYLSGTNRIVDALIMAVALAAGVGTVLKIWLRVFGGVTF